MPFSLLSSALVLAAVLAAQPSTERLLSAEDVARLAVAALARGQRTIIPYLGGKFTAFLVRFLPVGLITRFIEKAARPT